MSATFASLRYVNYRYWFIASLIASPARGFSASPRTGTC